MIFLTSDLHFNHDREFIWKARGFNSVEEMNEGIISRINEVVRPKDELYILGDLCLADLEMGRDCLSRLNGNLHVVWGNHDTDRRKQMYKELPNFVEDGHSIFLKYGKYKFFMCHYPVLTGNLEKESLKQMALCLYAHTHQKNNFFYDLPYCYHVGVDSHDCYPVSIDDIIAQMRNKAIECKEML